MSLPARLYAIPDRTPKPTFPNGKPIQRRNPEERRARLERELDAKEAIDTFCGILDRLDTRVENYKAAISLLAQRKQLAEQRIERLKEEALLRMEQAHILQAPGFQRSLEARPATPSLEVIQEDLIPDEFIRERITRTVDKVGLKAAIARGLECAGVRLMMKVSLVRK